MEEYVGNSYSPESKIFPHAQALSVDNKTVVQDYAGVYGEIHPSDPPDLSVEHLDVNCSGSLQGGGVDTWLSAF